MEEQKFVIPFFKLQRVFPKDTMWVDGIAEIVGYSPKENLHFVIDDGNRASDDGKYVVHALDQKASCIILFIGMQENILSNIL